MKKVLVSGASGIIGYGILRSLKHSGSALQLIGTSIYENSPAPFFCDVFEKAVPTNDSGYIDWLLEMIAKYKIDLLIPGIESDMYKWAEHIPAIKKTGAAVLINDTELITLCKDKWNFYQKLVEQQSPYAIKSTLASDHDELAKEFGLPFLLKPRSGHGSKGIVRVDSSEIFLKYKNDIGAVLMAQPIIGNEDEEYTCSAFCDGKGGYYASMTLKRKLSKEGYTVSAEVAEISQMDEALKNLCRLFKPVGPTNFQFRLQDGNLKLLEINPRISSATSIRTAFGYNESLMALEYLLEGKTPQQPLIKKGKAVRYIEDLIMYDEKGNNS